MKKGVRKDTEQTPSQQHFEEKTQEGGFDLFGGFDVEPIKWNTIFIRILLNSNDILFAALGVAGGRRRYV